MRPVIARELREYLTADGRSPFGEWLRSLTDVRTEAIIRKRLNRVRLGNLGDCKSVGERVLELRIDHGPGFRIYLGEANEVLVILLCGGDKKTQEADIRRAKTYWASYWRDHAEAHQEL